MQVATSARAVGSYAHRQSRRKVKGIALTAAVAAATASTGFAATVTWNNTGTDFNTGANWSTSAVPGAADNATFTGPEATNPNLSAIDTIQGLTFSTANSAGYNLSGLALTLTNTGTGGSAAYNAGNTSGVNILGAPIVLGTNTSTATFAQATGGTLNISGGVTAASGVLESMSFTGGGKFNINSAVTLVSAANSASVGNIAVGTAASGSSAVLNISANVSVVGMEIGNGTGANSGGAVYQTAGTVTLFDNTTGSGATSPDRIFSLGGAGSATANGGYGYYNITGGSLTGNQLDVGCRANGSIGVMDVAGGTVTANNVINIGRGQGTVTLTEGVLNIKGGAVNVDASNGTSNLQMGIVANGVSIVDVGGGSGTATLTTGNNTAAGVDFGNSNVAAASYLNLLTGGTLNTSKLFSSQVTPTSFLSFNGGTLRANNNSAGAAFMNSTTNVKNVVVYSGGGTIDNNGSNITIATPLISPSGNGLTNIAVSGAGTGYIGVPAVNITGGGGSGATAVAVMSNGTITGINITSPGFGYTGTPTVTLTGGGFGTAATVGTITTAANTTGGMTFAGSGVTTLIGASTYSGLATINGKVTLSGSGSLNGSSQINVSGGTLTHASSTAISPTVLVTSNGIFTAAGNVSVSGLVNINSGNLSMVDGTFNTLSVTGASGLQLNGTGDVLAFEGGTNTSDTINVTNALTVGANGAKILITGAQASQTYTLMNFGSATFNGNAFTPASGVTSADGLTVPFGIPGTLNITSTSVQLVMASTTAPPSAYWSGNQGANWTDNDGSVGNFTTTLNGSNGITSYPGPVTDVYFANNGATNLTNTLGTLNFDIHSLNFLPSSSPVTINNGTIGNTLTLEAGGIQMSSGSANATVAVSTVILNADQTWTNNSTTGSVTVNSAINGPHALTLTGGGTFNFTSSTSNYSNGTLVNGGTTLSATNAGALGATGANFTLDNGTLVTNNTAIFTDPDAIIINPGGGTITITPTGTTGGAGQFYIHTINDLQGSGPLTVQGNGTLNTTGAGNLRIDNANTYSGNVTLQNGGSLEYGANAAISSSLVTIGNQGEFITQGSTTTPVNNTVNVNVSGGTNSVISFENGNAGVLSGNVSLGANGIVGLRDWYNYNTVVSGTMSGTITGTGSLTVNSGNGSGGVLFLTNSSNTYSGSTTITNSTVNVAALGNINSPSSIGAGSVAGSPADLVLDGGTIAYNGGSGQTTNRPFTLTTNGGGINSSGSSTVTFSASGPITLTGSGARTFTLTGSATGANTLNPGITDGGGSTTLVKSGAGQWNLTGSNTYSGTTNVSAGILVTGNLPNTSNVLIGSNGSAASLDVTATVNNPVGTGTIAFDSVGNGSTANFQISGGVTLSNPINFPARNNTTAAIESVSGNNTFTGLMTFGTGGASYPIQSDSGTLNISNPTVTPLGTGKALMFQGAGNGNNSTSYNGAGGITVAGPGTWTFTGTNTYTGPTVVSGGSFILASGGSLSATSGVNISSGAIFDISAVPSFALTSAAILSGSGTVIGNYNQTAGTLAPGGIGTAGQLNVTGNVNLAGGTLALDLNGNSGSDLLNITGNLALGGPMTLGTNFLNPASVGNQFTIIDFSGTMSGSLSNLASTTRGFSLSNTSNSVILTVTSSGSANLNWNSSSSGAWDVTTSSNWFNTGSNMQDMFFQGDAVNFLDTPGVQTSITINTTVTPASTNINSSTNSYTFNGSGGIGGTGALTKYGSSVLTLDGSNSYAGGTTINGGVIAINSNTSLGAVTGLLTINAGTLEVTTNITSSRQINLSGGSATIQVDPGVTYTLNSNVSDGATAGTLVKTGTGILTIGGTNTYSGGTNISAGTIIATGTLAAANSNLIIGPNGNLNISTGINTNTVTGSGNIFSTGITVAGNETGFAGTFTHNSSTASTSFSNSNATSGSAAYVMTTNQGSLQGFIAGNGGLTLNIGSLSGVTNSLFRGANSGTAGVTTLAIGNLGANTTFNGNIQDGSVVQIALTKVGAGSLTLTGTDAYTQGTNVSGGTLILGSAAAFPANSSLIVGTGATLQVANHGGNAVYVPTVGSLTNTGTVDVTNNDMLIHNTSAGAVFSQIQAGFNNGSWNGSSGSGVITSSLAAADSAHLTAVGFISNVSSGTFDGQTLSATTDALVKETYYGDTDLSGVVDGSDYSRIDNAYLANQTSPGSMTGWQNGDFNYDGVINGSDYTLIDNAFNTQGASLATQVANPSAGIAAEIAGGASSAAGEASAVPEPATLGLLGIGVLGLLGRRSRRAVV